MHLKYSFSVENCIIVAKFNMKFVFYCYAVSLMPVGAWQHFWQKINVLEIFRPKPVTLKGKEIFQNFPEPLAKL